LGLFFSKIYDYLENKKWILYLILIIWIFVSFVIIKNIKFEDDIYSALPKDQEIEKVNDVLKKTPYLKRVYIIIKKDTSNLYPSDIENVAADFNEILTKETKGIPVNIISKNDDEIAKELINLVHNNIPYYLDSTDYKIINNQLNKDTISDLFSKGYNQLISPAGFAFKDAFISDPLGITWLGLKKFNSLNINNNFIFNNGYICTRDGLNILIFLDPLYNIGETETNKKLIDKLEKSIHETCKIHSNYEINYFGAPAVTLENSNQIRKDMALTMTISLILLTVILLYFFKNWLIIPILFSPVLFGITTGICLLSIIKGTISVISIAIGSAMMGLILDFSIHAYNHAKVNGSIKKMISDLSPILMATSGTTILAFLCLIFLKSNLLSDLGIFSAISVGSGAIFTIVFFPHIIGNSIKYNKLNNINIPEGQGKFKRWIYLSFTLLFIISLYNIRKIKFEDQMDKFSFIPDKLKKTEEYLDKISEFKLKTVYLISSGNNFNEALYNQQKQVNKLNELKTNKIINNYICINEFWPTIEERNKLQNEWTKFWDKEKKEVLKININNEATKYNFQSNTFNNFHNWINNPQLYSDNRATDLLNKLFFKNLTIQTENETSLVTLIKVDETKKDELYKSFGKEVFIFDNRFVLNKLIDILKNDFQVLIGLTTIFVFFIVLITFRRIEISIVTLIPLFLSWIITLGMMGLFDQNFNIFNIIICTLIFGLGIDYSILIGKGQLDKYRGDKKSLPTFKISILLSLITTLTGIGILIIAKHPALRSIAIISIIGLFSVAFISYYILPSFYNYIFYNGNKTRYVNITIKNILITVYLLSSYIIIGLFLYLFGKIITIFFTNKINLFERAYSSSMRILIKYSIVIKSNNILNINYNDFQKSIIIMNHQSMLDLVVIGAISGKIRVVTKDWIFNVPIMGSVAKMLGFYTLEETKSPEFPSRIKNDIDNGYSVLFFPESTRSEDQSIHRFKKGAFYLSSITGIDIQPILINGTGAAMPKNSLLISGGFFSLNILNKIKAIDNNFSSDYREKTKQVCNMMREKHHLFRLHTEKLETLKKDIYPRYIYRSKNVRDAYSKLFKNYDVLNSLNESIEYNEKLFIVGTNYGELVSFLLYTGPMRKTCIYENDQEKINEILFLKNWHSEINISKLSEETLENKTLILQNYSPTYEFYNLAYHSNFNKIIVINPTLLPVNDYRWNINFNKYFYILKKHEII
jgi:1-acyl-sn-glycerol-3-phosphate acyltransferase